MTSELKERKLIAEEELPRDRIQANDQIREFVRHNALGHHASCTCKISKTPHPGISASSRP